MNLWVYFIQTATASDHQKGQVMSFLGTLSHAALQGQSLTVASFVSGAYSSPWGVGLQGHPQERILHSYTDPQVAVPTEQQFGSVPSLCKGTP